MPTDKMDECAECACSLRMLIEFISQVISPMQIPQRFITRCGVFHANLLLIRWIIFYSANASRRLVACSIRCASLTSNAGIETEKKRKRKIRIALANNVSKVRQIRFSSVLLKCNMTDVKYDLITLFSFISFSVLFFSFDIPFACRALRSGRVIHIYTI